MFITKINNPRKESYKKKTIKKKYYCDKYDTCINGSITGKCKKDINPKKCTSYEEITGRCLTFEMPL